MVLDLSLNPFPGNVVSLVAEAMQRIDGDVRVFERPLDPKDPHLSVGVFGALWMPDDDSHEMGHAPSEEPTLSTYQIGVHGLIKAADREPGLRLHSLFAGRIRSVLYRDPALRVGLQALAVNDGLSTERYRRSRVRNQRFMNNEIDKAFVYLSVLDLTIETEML